MVLNKFSKAIDSDIKYSFDFYKVASGWTYSIRKNYSVIVYVDMQI